MTQSSNHESRRHWSRLLRHDRSCAACGARATRRTADVPFCAECLAWARQKNLMEWDDLGAGD